MDFVVRYWDNVKSEVLVRCLHSKFLGHAAALDIHEFNKGITELIKDNCCRYQWMVQVSIGHF